MDKAPFWNKPRLIVLVLLTTFFLSGLLETLLKLPTEQLNSVSIFHSLLVVMLCVTWCHVDASYRGIPLPEKTTPLVFLITPLGLPLYLWRTRPHRRFLLYCVKLLGLLVLATILAFMGQSLLGWMGR